MGKQGGRRMRLYLVQHGESKSKEEDPGRSLTERGREVVERMADIASGMGVDPDVIYHSDKLRAKQTAEILAGRINPSAGIEEVEGIAPMDDPAIAQELAESEERTLMLTGHLPHLSRLASLLLTGDKERDIIAFRNGGIVALSRHEGDWNVDWIVVPEIME
jgi:phosphohistidine phosphatase